MPIKVFLRVIIIFFICLPAFASEFVEGKHYLVLDTPKAKQKEIREYFSFYCDSCYSQQSFMKELERGMPRRAKFVKNHVQGVDGLDPVIEKLLTKSIITAEKMRMRDKVVTAIFDRIQKQKKPIKTAEEMKALFISLGGSEFMFDSTFNSFSIDIQLEEMEKNTELVRAAGEKSIPSLIINGRYKPLTSRITSMAQYKDLIYFLLRK